MSQTSRALVPRAATVQGAAPAQHDTPALLRLAIFAWFLGLALLHGCGGTSGTNGTPDAATPAVISDPTGQETFADSGACSQAETFTWLRANVRSNYLWSDITPDREPAGYVTLASYFRALLFTGNERIPADRYSGYSSAVAFARFYGEGKTMGYGVAVAGQEVLGQPELPLYIRYVEPASPGAVAGVRRGQRVLAINGRSTPDLIASSDFSALTANNEGDELSLLVEDGGVVKNLKVTAGIFDLTPARLGQILTSPGGRRVGYLFVQNMVAQTESELSSTFGRFISQGIDAVVLDLRYNGGGLVSVGNRLASYVAGSPANGIVYARLQYNTQSAGNNATYRFYDPAMWGGVKRAYVLTGSRTCSASEQVIQGLAGAGVEVMTIGNTTCGKPVGFLPQTYCDRTYSLVNFESINAKGEGGYYNGLSPTCRVNEDVTRPIGSPSEALLSAALGHLDGRGCPAVAHADQQAASVRRLTTRRPVEPDLWQGMVGR